MLKIKKLVSALVLTTVVMAGFAGCAKSTSSDASTDSSKPAAATSSIDAIKKRGTIKIGVFSDKAPFGYVDSNGKNQGFDVYIAKRFAKDLLGDENKVEFV